MIKSLLKVTIISCLFYSCVPLKECQKSLTDTQALLTVCEKSLLESQNLLAEYENKNIDCEDEAKGKYVEAKLISKVQDPDEIGFFTVE